MDSSIFTSLELTFWFSLTIILSTYVIDFFNNNNKKLKEKQSNMALMSYYLDYIKEYDFSNKFSNSNYHFFSQDKSLVIERQEDCYKIFKTSKATKTPCWWLSGKFGDGSISGEQFNFDEILFDGSENYELNKMIDQYCIDINPQRSYHKNSRHRIDHMGCVG